jgi:hypothetical protein
MLDKAVQYFLDTASNADKCQDDIWLFGGVKHEGWRPPLSSVDGDGFDDSESLGSGGGGAKPNSKRWSPIKTRATRQQRERQQSRDTVNSRSSREGADESPSPSLRSFSTTDSSSFAHSPSSPEPSPPQTTINGWPASFFQDFYSRPALTYRSHFTPIPCSPSKPGGGGATGAMHGMFNSLSLSIGRGGSGGNARDSTRGGVGEENGGLSSDTGWGCMLRTGQSLLANALVTAHLGRGESILCSRLALSVKTDISPLTQIGDDLYHHLLYLLLLPTVNLHLPFLILLLYLSRTQLTHESSHFSSTLLLRRLPSRFTSSLSRDKDLVNRLENGLGHLPPLERSRN